MAFAAAAFALPRVKEGRPKKTRDGRTFWTVGGAAIVSIRKHRGTGATTRAGAVDASGRRSALSGLS